MSLKKFGKKDVLRNTIKTHPNNNFYIFDKKIVYNDRGEIEGVHTTNVTHVPMGHISLNEMNVDRDSFIYPFIYKSSENDSFTSIGNAEYSNFLIGDIITGSYQLSSSIVRNFFDTNHNSLYLSSLKNTLNYYKINSINYEYSNSDWNKATQQINLISIPSVFYGSEIKRGSVKLKCFISGTLISMCEDINQNGELIQTSGSSLYSGSVAGVVLYKEGFILLTGSWGMSDETYQFGDLTPESMKWIHFAMGADDGETVITPSASFSLDFKGTNYINTLTMFAEAPSGELNYSCNPTFLEKKEIVSHTSSFGYFENNRTVKNIVSSSFHDYNEEFRPETYISTINIYDKDKNLIMVAKLAKPIRKTEKRDLTFKLKYDL